MFKLILDDETNLYIGLFRNVKNLCSIRKRAISGDLLCGLLKPSLIVDRLQIAVAAYKAHNSNCNYEMATKNIYSELLFNLSPSKNISQSLNKFGVSDKDENAIVVFFGRDDDEYEKLISHLDGEHLDLEHLPAFTDISEFKNTYGLTGNVLQVCSLRDAVVTRISTKQCILLTFLPSLAYNIVMEKFGSRHWYDRMDGTVILGALPFRSIAKRLILEEKVGGVISMNEDFELKFCYGPSQWANEGVSFLQLSTTDIFCAPDQNKLDRGVAFIDEFRGTDRSVYVHCKAGRTRSTTLVACYLMKFYNMTPPQAVSFIIQKRPHILLRSKQWDAMNEFYKKLKSNRSVT